MCVCAGPLAEVTPANQPILLTQRFIISNSQQDTVPCLSEVKGGKDTSVGGFRSPWLHYSEGGLGAPPACLCPWSSQHRSAQGSDLTRTSVASCTTALQLLRAPGPIQLCFRLVSNESTVFTKSTPSRCSALWGNALDSA